LESRPVEKKEGKNPKKKKKIDTPWLRQRRKGGVRKKKAKRSGASTWARGGTQGGKKRHSCGGWDEP